MLHLSFVLIPELLFEFLIICLSHSPLMLFPLPLNLEFLQLLLSFDLLLKLSFMHDIRQQELRMKRLYLILLHI